MEGEMNQTPMQEMPTSSQKKSFVLWVFVVLVVIIVALLALTQFKADDKSVKEENTPTTDVSTEVSPEAPVNTVEDTTPVLNQDLNSIDTGNLEQELQKINEDINKL